MPDLAGALRRDEYPGRIVGCACMPDGEVVAFYALTGRSPASLDRHLVLTDDRNLAMASISDSGHDSLQNYIAVTFGDRWIVVGNGEQVSVMHNRLAAGEVPALAVGGPEDEPNPPLCTPRITALGDR